MQCWTSVACELIGNNVKQVTAGCVVEVAFWKGGTCYWLSGCVFWAVWRVLVRCLGNIECRERAIPPAECVGHCLRYILLHSASGVDSAVAVGSLWLSLYCLPETFWVLVYCCNHVITLLGVVFAVTLSDLCPDRPCCVRQINILRCTANVNVYTQFLCLLAGFSVRSVLQ